MTTRRFPLFACCAFGALTIAGMLGCGGDSPVAPMINTDPATIFARARLNYHSINLTAPPYDTITAAVKAYNAAGSELSLTDATVRFTSSDTTVVSVSQDGHIVPLKADVAAWVIASVRINHVTHLDSARVIRLTTEPVITGISAAVIAPDTAFVSPGTRNKIVPVRLSGTNLAGVAVHYEVPDTTTAALYISLFQRRAALTANAASSGVVSAKIGGIVPGIVMVHVSTTLRGVTWEDSVSYTVRPVWGTANIQLTQVTLRDGTVKNVPTVDPVYVKAGGVVTWWLYGSSVVFDDPSKAYPGATSGASAVSGNIEAWTPASFADNTRLRTFIAPDTIHWHSPERKAEGTLIVFDETTCLPFDCPPSS
jgi:hypothetical protein